jgi:lipoprotein-releasing system permease protein
VNSTERLRIALRYTLAFGRGHLSVFMSTLSIIGLILGTAVLLTVLSVMNGFDREMRERILAMVPHLTVHTTPDPIAARAQAERLTALPWVESARPFVHFEAVAVNGREVAIVSGLGLEQLPTVLADSYALPDLQSMQGVVLGDSVAQRLKVTAGQHIRLIVPDSDPRAGGRALSQRLPVEAVVDTGTELDETLLLVSLELASRLAGLEEGVSGLHLQIEDPFAAARRLPQLRGVIDPGSYVTSWRMTHGNLYAAIQLSRDLVVLLLASIIGVAAFNVVSALVLVVIDKRGAVAILRTLGAVPGDMAWFFMAQGLLIGIIGATVGCALGAGISIALPQLIAVLEQALGFTFLNTDVYPVSFIPVDLRASDALIIAGTAIGMCVVAAVYPALRASRLEPAQVLRQER